LNVLAILFCAIRLITACAAAMARSVPPFLPPDIGLTSHHRIELAGLSSEFALGQITNCQRLILRGPLTVLGPSAALCNVHAWPEPRLTLPPFDESHGDENRAASLNGGPVFLERHGADIIDVSRPSPQFLIDERIPWDISVS
jgi:hypothetical protein